MEEGWLSCNIRCPPNWTTRTRLYADSAVHTVPSAQPSPGTSRSMAAGAAATGSPRRRCRGTKMRPAADRIPGDYRRHDHGDGRSPDVDGVAEVGSEEAHRHHLQPRHHGPGEDGGGQP